jgi:hypothetical protein
VDSSLFRLRLERALLSSIVQKIKGAVVDISREVARISITAPMMMFKDTSTCASQGVTVRIRSGVATKVQVSELHYPGLRTRNDRKVHAVAFEIDGRRARLESVRPLDVQGIREGDKLRIAGTPGYGGLDVFAYVNLTTGAEFHHGYWRWFLVAALFALVGIVILASYLPDALQDGIGKTLAIGVYGGGFLLFASLTFYAGYRVLRASKLLREARRS